MIDAIFIKNPNPESSALGIWFFGCYDVKDNCFSTRTQVGLSQDRSEFYSAQQHQNRKDWIIYPKGDVVGYEQCSWDEAEIIKIPYYMGNAMEHVVEIRPDGKFVVEGKMPLGRRLDENNEVVYDQPKLNTILNYTAYEWYPYTKFWMYRGELLKTELANTLIEMAEGAKFTTLKKLVVSE
jgi:hypothetical protein